MSLLDACKRLLPGAVRDPAPAPVPSHEAYAALYAALCGSGVLTREECDRWAQCIIVWTGIEG